MPRMIDVIRNSALPSNTMQFAAKGALLVPPHEMLEILVYLAKHNKVFGEQARLTLAGWDEVSAQEAARNPKTPVEVLEYLIDPVNLRPALLPALMENPAVGESQLVKLANSVMREQAETMLASPRVMQSPVILSVLASNPTLRQNETRAVQQRLKDLEPGAAESGVPSPEASAAKVEENGPVEASGGGPEAGVENVSDAALEAFLKEHAAEIAGTEEKPFQAIGGIYEELPASTEPAAVAAAAAPATAEASGGAAAAPQRAAMKKWILSADEQRGSALQKISKLDVKGRIQLAMKGNKEERSILVRDGTKLVALSVLDSPKITDAEVEKIAGQKNVLDAVLRAIPMRRRFMKMYPVVRNLTFNPRTPIDVSLGLLKNLMVQDLRSLSGNKEVSETVRKLATKMFRQKLDVTKK